MTHPCTHTYPRPRPRTSPPTTHTYIPPSTSPPTTHTYLPPSTSPPTTRTYPHPQTSPPATPIWRMRGGERMWRRRAMCMIGMIYPALLSGQGSCWGGLPIITFLTHMIVLRKRYKHRRCGSRVSAYSICGKSWQPRRTGKGTYYHTLPKHGSGYRISDSHEEPCPHLTRQRLHLHAQ